MSDENLPKEVEMVLREIDPAVLGKERPNRTYNFDNSIIDDGVIKPLIFTNNGKHPRDVRMAGTAYSDEKKIEVVAIYLSTQSRQETANVSGVPLQTVNSWIKSKWWDTACTKVRTLDKSKKLSKISRIVNQALDLVADRIENGDYIYDQRSGEVKRVPMSSKNAITASSTMIDRFLLLNKSFEDVDERKDTHEKLNQLADAFTKFAQGKKPDFTNTTQEPIEGSFEEVVEEN